MDYRQEYDEFLKSYRRGTTDAEMVGFLVTKFAGYYAEHAMEKASAEISFNAKAAENERAKDDAGKPVSSTKARVFSEASDEYSTLVVAKAHLDSVEQILNALKSLQKGLLNEFSYANN